MLPSRSHIAACQLACQEPQCGINLGEVDVRLRGDHGSRCAERRAHDTGAGFHSLGG